MNNQYDIENYILGNETNSAAVWHELAVSQTWNTMDALQHMKEAFKRIDGDQNGYLSERELRKAFESTGEDGDPEVRLVASATNRMRDSLSAKSNDEWGSEREITANDIDEMIAEATSAPDSRIHTEIRETFAEARFEQALLAVTGDMKYLDTDADGILTRIELDAPTMPDGVKSTADFVRFNYARLTAMINEISVPVNSSLIGGLSMLNNQANEYRNINLTQNARTWGALAAAYAAYSGCEPGIVPAYAAGAAGGLASGLLYQKIMRNYVHNMRNGLAGLSYPDSADRP